MNLKARTIEIYARPGNTPESVRGAIYWRLEPEFTVKTRGDKTLYLVALTKKEYEQLEKVK